MIVYNKRLSKEFAILRERFKKLKLENEKLKIENEKLKQQLYPAHSSFDERIENLIKTQYEEDAE